MALNASKVPARKSNVTPMEAGTYPARLVSVVDLGLQSQKPYKGEDREPVRMFAPTYEFLDEFLKDEDGQDMTDKPRWLTDKLPFYSLSSERAKSTIRYRAIDPNEVHGGDWTKLLDTPVMITVVINPGDNGKVYENIGAVSAMRQKDADKAPPLVNKAFFFDLDEPNLESWRLIPKWMQDLIKGNLEYNGSKLEKLLAGQPGEQSKPAQPKSKPQLKVVAKTEPESETDDTPY